jgi:hypothetical protein
MNTPLRLQAVAALLAVAALGCTDDNALTKVSGPSPNSSVTNSGAANSSITWTPIEFTVGPLVITGIDQSFPGDNWHLRDIQLSGPVTGGLSGNASITLNANLDAVLGSGPAWGTVRIVTTGEDVWQGTLTGTFQSGAPLGIQLFSQAFLRGPDNQTLKAECNETSVTSETLACTGKILN